MENRAVIVFMPTRFIRIIPYTLHQHHPFPYQPIRYHHHHLMPKPQQNPYTNKPIGETSNNYAAETTVKSIWKFPGYDYLKLNTDGSSKGNPGLSSYGGLIRDGRGRWVCGYMGKMNGRSFTSLDAEVWSVYRGLCLIRDNNLSNLLIETDCQAILMLGAGEIDDNCHPLIKSAVEAIKTILIEHKCTIIHTRRDGNHCADQLAKLGGKQSEEHLVLEEPPAQLIPYLLRDVEAAEDFERNRHQSS